MLHYSDLAEVVRRDPRYPIEAYQFVEAALIHTQKVLGKPAAAEEGDVGRQHHVTGRELLDGVRDLALREFGLLARTVFHMWGIEQTDDFGEIVFNLVESKKWSKTDADGREDFHGVYNLDEALVHGYRIRLDEAQ